MFHWWDPEDWRKRIFDPAVAGKLIAHIEEAIRRVEPRYRCRRLTNV